MSFQTKAQKDMYTYIIKKASNSIVLSNNDVSMYPKQKEKKIKS